MKSILFIGLNQLPHRYLHNYCVHLSERYVVTIISRDDGLNKIECDAYKSIYIGKHRGISKKKLVRKFRTLLGIMETICAVKKHVQIHKYDVIYIWDQTWAFLFKLTLGFRHKYIMQMFAPGVSGSKLKNLIHDYQVRINVLFFDNVFMGSERAKQFFNVPDYKAYITGVGVEGIGFRERSFKSMNLVYLGALTNRYVDESVLGFIRFYNANKDQISMSYKIIGGGDEGSVNSMKTIIENEGFGVPVQYLGRLDDDQVLEVFNASNIGVVYNRVTSYYTNNISTKLYEYLLSGMPVIAVKNSSLLSVVTQDNGVTVEDNPESFEAGLKMIMSSLDNYNSERIAMSGSACSVAKIVQDRLIPYLDKIIGGAS